MTTEGKLVSVRIFPHDESIVVRMEQSRYRNHKNVTLYGQEGGPVSPTKLQLLIELTQEAAVDMAHAILDEYETRGHEPTAREFLTWLFGQGYSLDKTDHGGADEEIKSWVDANIADYMEKHDDPTQA